MNRLIIVALALALVACVPGAQEESVEPIEQEEPMEPVKQEGSVEPTGEGRVEGGLRPAIGELLDELGGRGGLRGLDANTERLIDEDAGNCPSDEFEIPGQGAHLKGSIGGLAVAPYPAGSTPGDVSATSEEIINLAAPALDQQAAILVVDDFNGEVGGMPSVYFPDRAGIETLRELPEDPDQRVEQQEVMMDGLEDNSQLSHGSLVFNHTLSLLNVLDPGMNFDTQSFSTPFAEFPKLGILVFPVDTEDFNTGEIADRTFETLREVNKLGISRFAINLSFGLVPCSVREDFRAAKEGLESPALTFEEYVERVLAVNPSIQDESESARDLREQLASLLTTPIENDPLLNLGEEKFGNMMITYAAAAGNYGYDWSLAPGYWSEFVSVSAENLSGPTGVKNPEYSNTGEVLLPGGFFELTFYDPANRMWVTYPDISVAGTSFAAPVLSVYTALDFTHSTPRCMPTPLSPLAYFNTNPPVSTPLPTLNEPLGTAVNRCP